MSNSYSFGTKPLSMGGTVLTITLLILVNESVSVVSNSTWAKIETFSCCHRMFYTVDFLKKCITCLPYFKCRELFTKYNLGPSIHQMYDKMKCANQQFIVCFYSGLDLMNGWDLDIPFLVVFQYFQR